MKTDSVQHWKQYFKTDLSSGLVVFLIALPLCLGISLASGAPLFSGIIAGIVGGIVVGAISDSNINVSGPAASVALVVFTGIEQLGSYEIVLVAVVLAGVLQIGLGFLRAGTVAYFFPNSMIKGILAAIGLMLIVKQIPHALGISEAFEDGVSFGGADPLGTLEDLAYDFHHVGWGATLITLASLTVILSWERLASKQRRFFQLFPAALAAVVVSIFIDEVYKVYFPGFALRDNQLVQLPVADSVPEFLSFFTFPDFAGGMRSEVISIAMSIAFIASLESLLSTEAGDKLDPYKRRTSTNHELKAQGIGNIVAGLLGGLPVTAVIVRTSANVAAGGRTKTSTIAHGTLMLVCVGLIPSLLNKIPLASLSAVLFVVGYKLTSFSVFRGVWRQGQRQFLPFITTVAAASLTDLITGILIGGIVSVFFILRDNSKNSFVKDYTEKNGGTNVTLTLSEECTFLNKADVILFLSHVPSDCHLVIDGRQSRHIHPDIYEIIMDFRQTAKFNNIELEILGLSESKIPGAPPAAAAAP